MAAGFFGKHNFPPLVFSEVAYLPPNKTAAFTLTVAISLNPFAKGEDLQGTGGVKLKIEIICYHFLKNIYSSVKPSLISFLWKIAFLIALLSCVPLNKAGIP